MKSIQFAATIEIRGINPYILVSAARAKKIKAEWKKPMPVLFRINGLPEKKAWKINMMPAGDGSFYLYLHGAVRKASQTKVGDRVKVEIEFNESYRGGPAPAPRWFTSALNKNAKAKKAWQALTPSRRKEVVRYLTALKSEEARQRNLEKVMRSLSGVKIRFMARDWN